MCRGWRGRRTAESEGGFGEGHRFAGGADRGRLGYGREDGVRCRRLDDDGNDGGRSRTWKRMSGIRAGVAVRMAAGRRGGEKGCRFPASKCSGFDFRMNRI